jgi:hypothetical protein
MLQIIDFDLLTQFAKHQGADSARILVPGGESRPCTACRNRGNPPSGWRSRRNRHVFRRGKPRTRVFKV